jgi:membrane fusion protein (multidrug efflux system)
VKGGVIIPQRCVGEFQGISFVYVVQDGKVSRRNISIQGIYRDYFLIGEGLAEGEKVVFEGIQKVSDGMEVEAEITEFQSKFN